MHRFNRSIPFALVVVTCWAAAASAQELPPVEPLRAAARSAVFEESEESPDGDSVPAHSPKRPRGLMPLYVSFGALQLLDVHSTTRALKYGAVEANPLMKGLAGHPAGLLGIKAAATGGVIYTTEKMWKRNKAAAITFMITANAAMTWVVHQNYRAARQ